MIGCKCSEIGDDEEIIEQLNRARLMMFVEDGKVGVVLENTVFAYFDCIGVGLGSNPLRLTTKRNVFRSGSFQR